MAVPLRTCVACRRRQAQDDLLRCSVTEGVVGIDPSSHRVGRGAYLCRRERCLEAALRGGGRVLLRALRRRDTDVVLDQGWLRRQWAQRATTNGRPAGRPEETA